jgi:hypothetical protein
VTIPVFAPPAVAAPPAQAACGSLGPPVCDLLVTVKAVLAPLEPVFAMGIPITDALGATVHAIQSTIEQVIGDPEAVNAQDLAQQIGDLLDQLAGVPEPVAATLSLLGLGGLRTALTDLQAALESQASAAAPSAPVAAATGASPTSVPVPSATPRRSGSKATTVPVVPEGAALDLPDLGLPVFGAPANRPARSAAATATPERPLELPTNFRGDDTGAIAAGIGISGLFLTAGLLASRSRRRRGSPEETAIDVLS